MEKEIRLKNGKAVLVRELRANDDVFDLCRFINEMIESKEYLLIDTKQTPEEETTWLEAKMKNLEKGDTIDWRAFLGGRCVAGVEARRGEWKRRGSVEFGLALSEEVRGQGLGRALLKMMIAEVKKEWKPHRMYIQALGGNARAIRLYESVGFKQIARIPDYNNHFGKYMDEVWLMLEEKK